MDEKDEKILAILRENSKLTTRQIAKKTRIPITTIHKRIKKLTEKGIIKKFTIEVDNKKLGKNIAAYLLIKADLGFLKTKKKTQHDMAKELKKFSFIEKVDIVTGGTDLVVLVRVKDIEELDEVLLNKIQNVDGISGTQTLVILSES